MKLVLQYIIDEDQAGFMEGRTIATNIYKTIEVIKYINDKQIPALIMSIDFEKCFNRIEYAAVRESLQYFNFGPKFTSWVMLCTQNNGFISPWFSPTHSVHQGCCLVPCLYLLCGQVLSHKIKENTNIKCIQVYDVMALLSQFTDDTTLFLSFDPISLQAVI